MKYKSKRKKHKRMRKDVSVSTLTFSSPIAESKPAETIINSGINWKIL